MKNLISFIKDKSYYFLGATVILLILVVVISSCSNKASTYEKIETNMINAAKSYYENKPKLLPKQDGGTVKVTIASLIDAELLKEVVDPKNKTNECSGYVEVTKVGKDYSYIPFLTCKGNYEPQYLLDKIKGIKQDEYGNGVYQVGNELVYRGDDVSNYVSFNNELWRIVKVDSDGDIKIVLANNTEDDYYFDYAYNSVAQKKVGITTEYLKTNIRKVLNNYYETNFDNDSKSRMVSKNLCIGKYSKNDVFSIEKECSIIKENEKISLLSPSDYQAASLDAGCTNLNSKECVNYNYLSKNSFYTWLINTSNSSTYHAFYLYGTVRETEANEDVPINPVIYLNSKTIIKNGNGTINNPYIIK